MINCSNHLRYDRTDRAVFILTTRGMGNPVAERASYNNTTMVLTDTGVILVYGYNKIVTMYYCTHAQARWVMNSDHLPEYLHNTIRKNHKQGYIEKQNKIKY